MAFSTILILFLAASGAAPIVGGAPTTADPAVAAVLPYDANMEILGVCSGTLIAPRVVLTAAHCVDDAIGAAGYVIYFGTDVTTSTDPGRLFVTAVPAAAATYHPQWTGEVESGFDVAVIQLEETPPIEPVPFNRTPFGPAQIGQPVRLVGWGRTSGTLEDLGVKRAVTSRIDDFDPTMVLIGNTETNICNGDSGGPAFATIGGTEVVVGVASFVDAGCTTIGVSTRVDAYVAFIEAAGGLEPPAEDPPGPGGENPFPTPPHAHDDGGCSAGGSGVGPLVVVVVTLVGLRLRRRRRGRAANPLPSIALVLAIACAGCPDPGGGTVTTACERFDECNALVDGVSADECVERVDRDLDLLTDSQREDWEGLMDGCLEFSTCQLFLQCVAASGL